MPRCLDADRTGDARALVAAPLPDCRAAFSKDDALLEAREAVRDAGRLCLDELRPARRCLNVLLLRGFDDDLDRVDAESLSLSLRFLA